MWLCFLPDLRKGGEREEAKGKEDDNGREGEKRNAERRERSTVAGSRYEVTTSNL